MSSVFAFWLPSRASLLDGLPFHSHVGRRGFVFDLSCLGYVMLPGSVGLSMFFIISGISFVRPLFHILMSFCILNTFSSNMLNHLFDPVNEIFHFSSCTFLFLELPFVCYLNPSFLLAFCSKLTFVIAFSFGVKQEAGSKKNS